MSNFIQLNNPVIPETSSSTQSVDWNPSKRKKNEIMITYVQKNLQEFSDLAIFYAPIDSNEFILTDSQPRGRSGGHNRTRSNVDSFWGDSKPSSLDHELVGETRLSSSSTSTENQSETYKYKRLLKMSRYSSTSLSEISTVSSSSSNDIKIDIKTNFDENKQDTGDDEVDDEDDNARFLKSSFDASFSSFSSSSFSSSESQSKKEKSKQKGDKGKVKDTETVKRKSRKIESFVSVEKRSVGTSTEPNMLEKRSIGVNTVPEMVIVKRSLMTNTETIETRSSMTNTEQNTVEKRSTGTNTKTFQIRSSGVNTESDMVEKRTAATNTEIIRTRSVETSIEPDMIVKKSIGINTETDRAIEKRSIFTNTENTQTCSVKIDTQPDLAEKRTVETTSTDATRTRSDTVEKRSVETQLIENGSDKAEKKSTEITRGADVKAMTRKVEESQPKGIVSHTIATPELQPNLTNIVTTANITSRKEYSEAEVLNLDPTEVESIKQTKKRSIDVQSKLITSKRRGEEVQSKANASQVDQTVANVSPTRTEASTKQSEKRSMEAQPKPITSEKAVEETWPMAYTGPAYQTIAEALPRTDLLTKRTQAKTFISERNVEEVSTQEITDSIYQPRAHVNTGSANIKLLQTSTMESLQPYATNEYDYLLSSNSTDPKEVTPDIVPSETIHIPQCNLLATQKQESLERFRNVRASLIQSPVQLQEYPGESKTLTKIKTEVFDFPTVISSRPPKSNTRSQTIETTPKNTETRTTTTATNSNQKPTAKKTDESQMPNYRRMLISSRTPSAISSSCHREANPPTSNRANVGQTENRERPRDENILQTSLPKPRNSRLEKIKEEELMEKTNIDTYKFAADIKTTRNVENVQSVEPPKQEVVKCETQEKTVSITNTSQTPQTKLQTLQKRDKCLVLFKYKTNLSPSHTILKNDNRHLDSIKSNRVFYEHTRGGDGGDGKDQASVVKRTLKHLTMIAKKCQTNLSQEQVRRPNVNVSVMPMHVFNLNELERKTVGSFNKEEELKWYLCSRSASATPVSMLKCTSKHVTAILQDNPDRVLLMCFYLNTMAFDTQFFHEVLEYQVLRFDNQTIEAQLSAQNIELNKNLNEIFPLDQIPNEIIGDSSDAIYSRQYRSYPIIIGYIPKDGNEDTPLVWRHYMTTQEFLNSRTVKRRKVVLALTKLNRVDLTDLVETIRSVESVTNVIFIEDEELEAKPARLAHINVNWPLPKWTQAKSEESGPANAFVPSSPDTLV